MSSGLHVVILLLRVLAAAGVDSVKCDGEGGLGAKQG